MSRSRAPSLSSALPRPFLLDVHPLTPPFYAHRARFPLLPFFFIYSDAFSSFTSRTMLHRCRHYVGAYKLSAIVI